MRAVVLAYTSGCIGSHDQLSWIICPVALIQTSAKSRSNKKNNRLRLFFRLFFHCHWKRTDIAHLTQDLALALVHVRGRIAAVALNWIGQ